MSTTFFVILMIIILFLLNPPLLLMTRTTSVSRVAAARRLLGSNSPNYASLKPKISSHGGFDKRGVVNACLPKGIRHSSAPSRYINYHPLGSTMCSPANHVASRPWLINMNFDQSLLWLLYVIIWLVSIYLFFFFLQLLIIEW